MDKSQLRQSFQEIKIIRAHGWWTRLRGLLGRLNLPMDEALWLKPCSSIHTVGMMFTIDVVFLSESCVITGVREKVRPFYFAIAPRGCESVLELASGGVEHYKLQIGDQLNLS